HVIAAKDPPSTLSCAVGVSWSSAARTLTVNDAATALPFCGELKETVGLLSTLSTLTVNVASAETWPCASCDCAVSVWFPSGLRGPTFAVHVIDSPVAGQDMLVK